MDPDTLSPNAKRIWSKGKEVIIGGSKVLWQQGVCAAGRQAQEEAEAELWHGLITCQGDCVGQESDEEELSRG